MPKVTLRLPKELLKSIGAIATRSNAKPDKVVAIMLSALCENEPLRKRVRPSKGK